MGARELQDVEKLIAAFSRQPPERLFQALVALLARSPKQASLIECELSTLLPKPPAVERPLEESVPAPPQPRRRALFIALGVLSCFFVCVLVGLALMAGPEAHSDGFELPGDLGTVSPSAGTHDDAARGAPDAGDVSPPSPPLAVPDLPPPPILHRISLEMLLIGGPALLLLFVLMLSLQRQRLHDWKCLSRRRELAAMNGPMQPSLRIPQGAPLITPQVLDDIATLFGRMRLGLPQSRRLNVPKTVEQTVRSAGLPSLSFSPHGSRLELLLLLDVGEEMRLWRPKMEALRDGLTCRGVPVSTYYLNGAAGTVKGSEVASGLDVARLCEQHFESPVLIVSCGAGAVVGKLDEPGAFAPWVRAYMQMPQRAWLHPICNPERWPRMLRHDREALRLLPFDGPGLEAAAEYLAKSAAQQCRIVRKGELAASAPLGVDTLWRLVSLWPEMSLPLVEVLRATFCPQVPEEALVELFANQASLGSDSIYIPPAERARRLRELQRSERHLDAEERLEDRARRYLLNEVLLKSKPPEDSVAYLRWQLLCAMQRLYLHDQVNKEVVEAIQTIKRLAEGALYEEVHLALSQVASPKKPDRQLDRQPIAAPVIRELKKELPRLLAQPLGGLVSSPNVELVERPSLPLPDRRTLCATLLLGGLAAAVVWLLKIGQEPQPHLEAYALSIERSADRSGAGALVIEKHAAAPDRVDLYRDDEQTPLSSMIALQDDRGRYPLRVQKEAHRYHVRARLPAQNWAYSQVVYVEGFEPPPLGKLQVMVYDQLSRRELKEAVIVVEAPKGRPTSLREGNSTMIPAGTVFIHASMTGYGSPLPQEFRVTPNTLSTAKLYLAPIVQTIQRKVVIQVVSAIDRKEIRDSIVEISDGSSRPVRARSGERLFVSVPQSAAKWPCKVSVKAKGYAPAVQSIDLAHGAQAIFPVRLEPQPTQSAVKDTPYVPVPYKVGQRPTIKEPEPAPEAKAPSPAVAPRAMRMIRISGGSFTMGSDDIDDERPPHLVTLPTFWIDETEVTVEQYQACVHAGRCYEPFPGNLCNWQHPERSLHPMNCIVWKHAKDYCAWAGKRLPTEAEWEYAARGTAGRLYAWGQDWDDTRVCGRKSSGNTSTCDVKAFASGRTPEGVYGLTGNVWEWVADCYQSTSYAQQLKERGSGPAGEALPLDKPLFDPKLCARRVLRGGSFRDGQRTMRASARISNPPGAMLENIGCRCARSGP